MTASIASNSNGATINLSPTNGTLTVNGSIVANNLSDVAYSGDYNDLINVPSSSGGTITDFWSDDDGNWYRKYSNGTIEQGGVFHKSESLRDCTVSFNTSFSSSSFAFVATSSRFANGDMAIVTYHIGEKTNSQIQIRVGNVNGISSTGYVDWFAVGR